MTVLLMSGLQIFNAHPALYIGEKSTFDDPVLAMGAVRGSGWRAGRRHARSSARHSTRPACSVSRKPHGELDGARLPVVDHPAELSGSRDRPALAFLLRLALRHQRARLHRATASRAGHWRQLVPTGGAASPHRQRRSASICSLRFPKGEEAKSYNVLQKLAYFGVIVVAGSGADPRRAHHVAGDGRRVPLAARSLRRPADARARSISSPRR